MIKYLITSYKKVPNLGDAVYLFDESTSYYRYILGKSIKVKILGIFWMEYSSFVYNKQK